MYIYIILSWRYLTVEMTGKGELWLTSEDKSDIYPSAATLSVQNRTADSNPDHRSMAPILLSHKARRANRYATLTMTKFVGRAMVI